MTKKTTNNIEMVEIQNDVDKLKETLTDIKLQIVATNVELVAIKKEVEGLKGELIGLRTMTQLLEKDLRNGIENLQRELAPFQRIFNIVGGLLITAVVGAILALVIKSQ